ncbi:unnamed protein product, partial [Didymodactylos carnosus]
MEIRQYFPGHWPIGESRVGFRKYIQRTFASTDKSHKPWLDCQFHDADQKSIKKPDELGIDAKNYPPAKMNDDLLDRIQGSIFGMALGDALGAHVEFRPHSYLVANPVKELLGGGTWGLQKGQVGND